LIQLRVLQSVSSCVALNSPDLQKTGTDGVSLRKAILLTGSLKLHLSPITGTCLNYSHNPGPMIPILTSGLPVIRHEYGMLLSGRIYLLASVSVLVIYLVAGYRRKIPLSQLLLGAATFFLFFALGSRLPAFSSAEWSQLLAHGEWPQAGNRTIMGGLAGLLAGVLLYASSTRNSQRIFDLVAIVLPVGLGIQRVGCLLSGCCSGVPTHLPWGIRYDPHADAWNSQLLSGHITAADPCSLPVHPAPLYDLLAWVFIFFLAALAARSFLSPGNRLLLTILLYGFFRFFLEFLRDPLYDLIPGAFGGIRYVQWMILAGLPWLAWIIMARERRAGRAGVLDARKEAVDEVEGATQPMEVSNLPMEAANQQTEASNQSVEVANQPAEEWEFSRHLIVVMIVVTVFILSWRLLNLPELLAMTLLLAFLFIMTASRVFRKDPVTRYSGDTTQAL
jgi:prolipoprotein diacylglyceryltransferase